MFSVNAKHHQRSDNLTLLQNFNYIIPSFCNIFFLFVEIFGIFVGISQLHLLKARNLVVVTLWVIKVNIHCGNVSCFSMCTLARRRLFILRHLMRLLSSRRPHKMTRQAVFGPPASCLKRVSSSSIPSSFLCAVPSVCRINHLQKQRTPAPRLRLKIKLADQANTSSSEIPFLCLVALQLHLTCFCCLDRLSHVTA